MSEKGETLGHLGQNSVARMNEYATRLFISKPREVPPHAVDKVVQFSNNFDTGESSPRNHERQQLASQLSISLNLRFFQRVNQVIAQTHRIDKRAEWFHVLHHSRRPAEMADTSPARSRGSQKGARAAEA